MAYENVVSPTYRELSPQPAKTELTKKEGRLLIGYSFFWSILFLLAVPVALLAYGGADTLGADFFLLLTSPSKLITDYFEIGGLAATLLNAGLCGLGCNLMMLLVRAKPSATLLAGYFLVVAHCFFGLNFINMWPPFFGIALYCAVKKVSYAESLPLSMFATSLGPFISEFLFRYTLGDAYVFGEVRLTVLGVLLSVLFSVLAGFLIPALLPGTTHMHRGFNLYKAGLAIGLFGMFAYALFFRTMGISAPETLTRLNPIYEANEKSYYFFMDVFFLVIFGLTLLYGFLANRKSFRGYRKLFDADGWRDDFPMQFGMPLTFINIAVYGICVLAFYNAVIFLTEGVGFTGPTAGVTIAAITFSACGQTPKNVWPIAFGYITLASLASGVCTIAGMEMTWSLSTQGYINGLAFATGLCPFTGRFGRRYGVIAGGLSAILCTSTAAMHGGFVLYNGGLTAGLSALLLVPILEFYHVKEKNLFS